MAAQARVTVEIVENVEEGLQKGSVAVTTQARKLFAYLPTTRLDRPQHRMRTCSH